jgi:hypothetical protein
LQVTKPLEAVLSVDFLHLAVVLSQLLCVLTVRPSGNEKHDYYEHDKHNPQDH